MRGNGCLLLTAYYWSFFNVLLKLDPPNCRVGLSMLSIHPGAGSYEAGHQLTSQTTSLKRHFISESDSIRGEQPGSKPNKSVCQVRNKSVESCLPLIAPTKTHKSHLRGEKNCQDFCENDWLHLFVIGFKLWMLAVSLKVSLKVWLFGLWAEASQPIKRPIRSNKQPCLRVSLIFWETHVFDFLPGVRWERWYHSNFCIVQMKL